MVVVIVMSRHEQEGGQGFADPDYSRWIMVVVVVVIMMAMALEESSFLRDGQPLLLAALLKNSCHGDHHDTRPNAP